MDEPQQIDLSKLPDQGDSPNTAHIDLSQLPDQHEGKSHGWLLDNLWNAGERAVDIGKGLLDASPLGQMSQASNTLSTLDKNPHAFDSQIASVGQQLHNVTAPQIATSLAMNTDPTGIVPGEVGLVKQIPSDIANKNYGGALTNTVLAGLPFVHAMSGEPKSTSDIAQVEPQIDLTKLPDQPESTSLLEAQDQAAALYEHHPNSIASTIDSNPSIAGERPIPDIVNSTPVSPARPGDANIARAGNAIPTLDVGPIKAELNGPNQELKNYPDTAIIAHNLEDGQVQRDAFLSRVTRQVAPAVNDLSNKDAVIVGKILSAEDYGKTPEDIIGVTPDLLARAKFIKSVTDEVHPLLTPEDPNKEVDTEGGEVNTVGYFNNYLSMIKKDTNNPLWNYFFGKANETTSGDVGSRFAQTRKGLIPEEDREFNVKKVLPLYLSSAARDIFMKPAITDSMYQLSKVPTDTNRFELAKAYINNASGYDSEPRLHQAWNQYANNAANMNARAYTDWNIPLHVLHAAKIPGVIWPELGSKYSSIGLYKTLSDPINSWNEVVRNGLAKGNLLPNQFKTFGQKYQSVANFFNLAEQLASSTGYFGAKQKFLDQGMHPNNATINAIKLSRVMNLTSDAASTPKFMTPESNWFGGVGGSKIVNQFKGPALQLTNFYYDAIKNWSENKPKAARTLAAMATLSYLGESHITNLGKDSISFYTKVAAIAHDLFVKPNVPKAVLDTIKLVVPGAGGIKKTTDALGSAMGG